MMQPKCKKLLKTDRDDPMTDPKVLEDLFCAAFKDKQCF